MRQNSMTVTTLKLIIIVRSFFYTAAHLQPVLIFYSSKKVAFYQLIVTFNAVKTSSFWWSELYTKPCSLQISCYYGNHDTFRVNESASFDQSEEAYRLRRVGSGLGLACRIQGSGFRVIVIDLGLRCRI